jgi:hypothetical protein
MASETQTQQRPFPPMEAWPPDDTEESILGTDLHQTTITNLRWGINEAARLNRQPGQLVPWKALCQIALLVLQRRIKRPAVTMHVHAAGGGDA